MKKVYYLVFSLILLLCFGCTQTQRQFQILPHPTQLRSICLIDRNGTSEVISNIERLKQFERMDFLSSQSYQKVMRIYHRNENGDVLALITSYYPNGQVMQYLEVVNSRAHGSYKEWHSNGVLKLEALVIGGEPDISPSSENSWLFDGHAYCWNEQGSLIADIPYEKGVLEGESIYYHPKGTIWKKVCFTAGEAQGVSTVFLENGELLQQFNYSKGKKSGPSRRYWNCDRLASEEEYDKDILVSGRYFDMDGALVSEIFDGNGYKAVFSKTEISELQEYRNGIQEGEVQVFGPDKKMVRKYNIKNKLNHGEDLEYYEEPLKRDIPKLLITWYEGKIQGIVKTWYDNGVQESNREISNNVKNGLSTAWYRDGSLMLLEEYDHNKLVKGEYYRRGEKRPISQVKEGKGLCTLFDSEGNFNLKVTYENGEPVDDPL